MLYKITSSKMPSLRIVCDDLGLSPRQNDHVVALANEGLFTGASILTNYAHAESVFKRLRDSGISDIGVHLNLSDGYPLSPLPRGATLLNRQGQFRDRLWILWRGWRIGEHLRQQIVGELRAQIDQFCRWGALPAHLDSHCHFHSIPQLTTLVRNLAQEYETKRIRVPHVRANLAPITRPQVNKVNRGVIINGKRNTLVLIEQWLKQSPYKLLLTIANCHGDIELVVHPGCTPDSTFPSNFRYSPQKRARESAYLHRFITSLRAEPHGIELLY